jgi:putative membrane protein
MKTLSPRLPSRLLHVALGVLFASAATLFAAEELRPVERDFLEKASDSGRQQMVLAQVGANHAGSSDIRSHAVQLLTDYKSLNNALETLIRRKGGLADAPVGGSSENYRELSTKAGSDFDRRFVHLASDLSETMMRLFEQASNTAKDPDVRDFANAQIPLLREHRNRSLELKKVFE